MDDAIAFMEEHYDEDLSLRTIAEQAPPEPASLFPRPSSAIAAFLPGKYLLQLRLERSKELLRSTTRSVTDIALSVGFGDSSYFARVFKVDTGLTPRTWRAKNSGEWCAAFGQSHSGEESVCVPTVACWAARWR